MTNLTEETTAEFSVSYEGPAVDGFTMPVRELAPALLGLGEAFERANTILNGTTAVVSLNIRATQQGSFEIVLSLQQMFEQGTNLFSGDFFSSAANLKELFFWGGGPGTVGVLGLIRWFGRSKPKEIARTEDNIVLEFDKLRLSAPIRALDLFKDLRIRESLEAFVKPVSAQGVDRLVVKENGQPIETVERTDVASFGVKEFPDLLGVSETEIVIPRQPLQLISINFSQDRKWQLNDGSKTHWYTIRDEGFANEVAEHKVLFGSGDILVCEVAMTQSFDENGKLSMHGHAINKVLTHVTAPKQVPLAEQKSLLAEVPS